MATWSSRCTPFVCLWSRCWKAQVDWTKQHRFYLCCPLSTVVRTYAKYKKFLTHHHVQLRLGRGSCQRQGGGPGEAHGHDGGATWGIQVQLQPQWLGSLHSALFHGRCNTPDPGFSEMARSIEPPCVFCNIVAGAERARVVFEDETTIVFQDIKPVATMHYLVVPREHLRDTNSLTSVHRDLLLV